MKKVLALLLAAILVFGLMACSTESPVDNSSSDKPAASTNDPKPAETNDDGGDAPEAPKADDSNDAPAAEPYKIGFALQTVEVPVFQRMSNGMEKACQDHGVEYQCMVSNSDTAKHIANILDLLRK